jgi:hypothetical protein
MTEKSQWNAALLVAAWFVLAVGGVAWLFPSAAASAIGNWALPLLSLAGLALALGLGADWRWLRGFLAVLATTLVWAWGKVPDLTTSTPHFAGASLGLLLMLSLARVVHTPQRLRWAMLTFLGGGFCVLLLGLAGAGADVAARVSSELPSAPLGLEGLEEGWVNPNALGAVALLVAPLGASVLLFRGRRRFDRLVLQPLGLVVFVAGVLVLVASHSRSAWVAVWLTLAALLVRGLRSWGLRLVVGAIVIALPLLVIGLLQTSGLDESIREAVHTRARVMSSGFTLLRTSPWLGIGLDQFRHMAGPPIAEGAAATAADARYRLTDQAGSEARRVDLERALGGGLVKRVAVLANVLTAPAPGASFRFIVHDLPRAPETEVFASGDWVRIVAVSGPAGSPTIADCWGLVSEYGVSGPGQQIWTFARAAGSNAGSMAAGTVVSAETVVLDYGDAYFILPHSHNMFLQTALDVGLVGLAAYCAVLGFLLIRANQAVWGPLRLARSAAVGAAFSLAAVSAFGLADAVTLGSKVGMIQWMAGGLILGAWRTQLESEVTVQGAAIREQRSHDLPATVSRNGSGQVDERVELLDLAGAGAR